MFDWNKIGDFVKKLLSLGALALLAWLGERGSDGGFIRDLWLAAKTASPFAAMFAILVWMDERRERREAQKQCADRTVDFIGATHTMAQSMDSVAAAVTGRKPRRRKGG